MQKRPVKLLKHKLEYSRITPYIFLGTTACCQAHFDKTLIKKGIKADISLEKERLDSPLGVDYFLWLPVKDHKAPKQKQLLLGAKSIDTLARNKIKCYVHCKAGHGRSPTLVIAYFILKGKTLDEAIRLVKQKRRSIHPNAEQIAALKQFEKGFGNG